MSDFNTSTSTLELNKEEPAVLPTGLNVLTILTFVGCGLILILTLCTPILDKIQLDFIAKTKSSGTELSAKQLEDMEKWKASVEMTEANLVPLMILSLVGVALCLVGAIWMRKFKKDGFWIYLGGELLPVIGSLILLGTAQFTGVASLLIGVGIPALFIILYATQRKYLVR